ncbi:MAG: YjhX family toxin [Pelagimonas sp.]|jgi:uncharacterized protein YjhX (UPF0386 family)|nr:YjhX family toxin [Pelagimonas sp.]
MNLSKIEQRVMHVLAQGGQIRFERGGNGRLTHVTCVTHDGMVLSGVSLELVNRLIRRGLIISRNSAPYRATDKGRRSVRAQLDNRV